MLKKNGVDVLDSGSIRFSK